MKMTKKESALFEVLMKYENEVADRVTISMAVYGTAVVDPNSRKIDMLVNRLRKKLTEHKITMAYAGGYVINRFN